MAHYGLKNWRLTPHSPHNPPAEFFNRFYQRNDLGSPSIAPWDVPPTSSGNVMARYNTLSEEEIRSLYAGYYGNIAFLDSQVGRLLQVAMQQRNTYVIFTSDHGEMLGDHYLMQKNRPYQGGGPYSIPDDGSGHRRQPHHYGAGRLA